MKKPSLKNEPLPGSNPEERVQRSTQQAPEPEPAGAPRLVRLVKCEATPGGLGAFLAKEWGCRGCHTIHHVDLTNGSEELLI